jgi:competence protein ComEC
MIPFLSRVDLLVVMCLPIIISIVIYLLYPLALLAFISKNFLYVFNLVIEFFEKMIGLLSIKQITFYLPKFNVYITLIFYGLLIWICFGKSRNRVIKRIFISAFSFFLVMMIQLKSYQERIVFLDVGQGDTTIIQVDHCNMVIDSFEGTLDYLVDHGIFHLDYLILTHSDQDHILEATDITKNIDVKQLILSAYDDNYPMFNQKAMRVKAYDNLKCGTIDLNILGPIRKYDLDNNNSVVLKFTYDQKDFLFTGDIETEAEIDLINSYHHTLKSDILKVPHHGSITSSSESFLTYVNPAYAIISLKTPNRYGFPSQDVLLRYIKNQTIIYRTDQLGTITYHGKKRKEKWSSYLSI